MKKYIEQLNKIADELDAIEPKNENQEDRLDMAIDSIYAAIEELEDA